MWEEFLVGFSSILKKGGLLVIGGWDKTDEVIAEDNNKARFTGQQTWPVNEMSALIQQMSEFELIINTIEDLPVEAFPNPRKIRYFIIKKQ